MKNSRFKTKKIIRFASFFLLVLVSFASYAQVGINTTNPNAILDIQSSNQVTPAFNDGIYILMLNFDRGTVVEKVIIN